MPSLRTETATIYALSSGALPAGLAVIRISGPQARFAGETLAKRALPTRRPVLSALWDGEGSEIDRGLVTFFEAPATATGEDIVELSVHGGPAVVSALLVTLARVPGLRLAEPGEFTRRAFIHGRLDLAEAEAVADLIAAETDMQRRQASAQAGGALSRRVESWRSRLLDARAAVEAVLDFSDEGDVGLEVDPGLMADLAALSGEMAQALGAAHAGERMRDGFQVVVAGAPNVGKSSLLNALAARDVAIVSPEAGTTRDVIEVRLDIAGYPVTVMDTAGLRQTDSVIEAEGIRRARKAAAAADLVLLVAEGPEPDWSEGAVFATGTAILRVVSKVDLIDSSAIRSVCDAAVSARSGKGIESLLDLIGRRASMMLRPREGAVLTRARHVEAVAGATAAVQRVIDSTGLPMEIVAEELRAAAACLGRVTGRVDVEDVLDRIFSEFCIGK